MNRMDRWTLWLAQGCGLGRSPLAPGTVGSLAGLVWALALLSLPNLWLSFAGALGGLAVSVWSAGRAEKILGATDPGSVVIDEIAALPLCFVGWGIEIWFRTGQAPPPVAHWSSQVWWGTLAAFTAFRFFDVLKPWPVRQSQSLPGGWGVTADDALAAVYVNLMLAPAWWLGWFRG
jgi:phosphatidylglycerophosphatase A